MNDSGRAVDADSVGGPPAVGSLAQPPLDTEPCLEQRNKR